MLNDIKTQLQAFIDESLTDQFSDEQPIPPIELEVPSDKHHGDVSTNIALKSAKILKKSPQDIAQNFMKKLQDSLKGSPFEEIISKIEVKGPGFINFFISDTGVLKVLDRVLEEGENFGRLLVGEKKKIQIEFVSANPTGPLSVAHARQAVVGDALANILQFIDFDVTREYYVNDEGNQINILGNSIRLRGLGCLGETIEFPEHGYQGDYIIDMAKLFMEQRSIDSVENLKKIEDIEFQNFGATYLLDVIKKELGDFGVHFDIYSHQSKIAHAKAIEEVLSDLKDKGHLYEKDGALWFASTQFGDDKDRVVRKSDGSYTYLTPDIVYHKDKYNRGFKQVYNIWGPDHHGYIPRIKASVEALGMERDAIEVLIVQLATIYRDGKPVSMSTRKGEFISLREVIEEVGVDAARYFFLMRHIKAHLEFDLELAKKQSAENPVYYIQYAHARIHSILRRAKEEGIDPKTSDFDKLKEDEELELIKKMGAFIDSLLAVHAQLDPYPVVNYLHELATCFHKCYDKHRVLDLENIELTSQRLGLLKAACIVLANGLNLLGVSQPESM